MGELSEPQWAVISERGCEATGLKYLPARDLMRRLVEQKIYGTVIVTAAAARRITHAATAANQSNSSVTSGRQA
jgi:hypothetical protein